MLTAVTGALVVAAGVRGIWSPCGLSMISALNPLTERARGHRFAGTAVWFVLGALVGGSVLGAVGAVGAAVVGRLPLSPAAVAGLAAAGVLIALAADSPSIRWHLPLIQRQVDERWIDSYRRWIYAAGFGAQIGCGLATYVMTAAVFLIPVLGALTGSPTTAILAGLLFGAVRGLAILVGGRAVDPLRLRRLHRGLAQLEPWSRRLMVAVQVTAAVLLSWTAGLGVFLAAVIALLCGVVAASRWRAKRPAGVIGRSTPAPVS